MGAKEKAMAEKMGAKEGAAPSSELKSCVSSAMKNIIPGYLDYGKKYRPEKVPDKTGWKLRPENKLMGKGR